MDGLRTLVLCTRDLTEQEFNAWKAAHHNAAIAIGKCNFQFYENKKRIPAKKKYICKNNNFTSLKKYYKFLNFTKFCTHFT